MSRRHARRKRDWIPGFLLVSPSLVAVGFFVYWLIGWNVKISLSKWSGPVRDDSFAGLGAYRQLWHDERWALSVKHALLFTLVFVVGSLVMGLVMALLLDKGVKGEGFFRSIYLFPMAISFVASGVVWRWLMNQSTGSRTTGLNKAFDALGLGVLKNDWWHNPHWGMAAMAMPAIWQISGYVMALFLAGLRSVPEELREAARMDGCSERQVYRWVVFPHLSPVALSALVIVGHISLKVFDLIVAVSGKQIISDVPAIYMWQEVFDARNYAKGATIATLLLLSVAVLVIPYLVYMRRTEKGS